MAQGEGERRWSKGAQRSPESTEAVLQAAEAIIAEGGLARFSIEGVARRAKAGKSTVYRWWPGKWALLFDVYHRKEPANASIDSGSVEGDIQLFLTNLADHWGRSDAGNVFRFLMAEAQSDADAAEALRHFTREQHQHAARIFERGVERGEIDPNSSAELAAEMLFGIACYQLLLRQKVGEEAIAQLARQMVRGLRSGSYPRDAS